MWEIKEVKEVNVYENNFKANDWFFLSLAMIISVACSTAVAAETPEDQIYISQ